MEGYSFQAQLTRLSPVGLVPEGLRIDVGFAGRITTGVLAGSDIEGVDYLLIRPDGVGVIDARERIAAPDGTSIALHAEGYVVPVFDMPELSTLLDPGFRWPDVDLPVHGSVRMQAGPPLFDVVNRSVYSFTGAVNMARGSLVVAARRIAGADRANADTLAAGYAAFAAGDVPAVLDRFASDICWQVPGSNPIAGQYKGHAEVAGLFTDVLTRSGGTFHLDIHDILSDGDRAVALVTEHAVAGGASLDAPAVHVWHFSDGKMAQFSGHYADPAAVDRFWVGT